MPLPMSTGGASATLILLATAADAFTILPRVTPGTVPRPCLPVSQTCVLHRDGKSASRLRRPMRARAKPVRQGLAIAMEHNFMMSPQGKPTSMAAGLDKHIDVDSSFPGVRQIHTSPDIFLVDGLLSGPECEEIVNAARDRGLELSPVAYAGWTEDAGIFARLLPIGALPTVNSMLNAGEPVYKVALVGLVIWGGLAAVFWGGAYLWAQKRTAELQKFRTSTSTILDGTSPAQQALVSRTEKLMKSSWEKFECPTVGFVALCLLIVDRVPPVLDPVVVRPVRLSDTKKGRR